MRRGLTDGDDLLHEERDFGIRPDPLCIVLDAQDADTERFVDQGCQGRRHRLTSWASAYDIRTRGGPAGASPRTRRMMRPIIGRNSAICRPSAMSPRREESGAGCGRYSMNAPRISNEMVSVGVQSNGHTAPGGTGRP